MNFDDLQVVFSVNLTPQTLPHFCMFHASQALKKPTNKQQNTLSDLPNVKPAINSFVFNLST